MMYLRIQKSHVFHQLIVIPFLKTSTTFDLPWILWRSNGLIDHHFWMINSLAVLVHFVYIQIFAMSCISLVALLMSLSVFPSVYRLHVHAVHCSFAFLHCPVMSKSQSTDWGWGVWEILHFRLSIGRRIDICVFVSSSCKYSSLFHPSVRTSHSHSFQCDTGCTLVILHVHKSEFSCSAHWFGQKFMKLRNCI